MKSKWFSSLLIKGFGLGCLAMASFSVPQLASAHGTIETPASRVWNCYQEGGNPTSAACQAAASVSGSYIYDWNGIRQGNADGDHQTVVPDGQLCSGGDPGTFGAMDLVRDDWVATSVSQGPQTFTWYNSAPHKSQYYRYYITNNSYNPNQALGWGDLTQIYQSQPRDGEVNPSHTVTLPARSGRHVVYAVWQRSDSPEAFYACVGIPNWDADAVYLNGDQVRFNDTRYEAKWWTRNENPAQNSSEWAVWIDQGACSGS